MRRDQDQGAEPGCPDTQTRGGGSGAGAGPGLDQSEDLRDRDDAAGEDSAEQRDRGSRNAAGRRRRGRQEVCSHHQGPSVSQDLLTFIEVVRKKEAFEEQEHKWRTGGEPGEV